MRSRKGPLICCLIVMVVWPTISFDARTATLVGVELQQHDGAPDAEEGGRVFQNICANCHGPDGDQVAGIHLTRGQFRKPLTDDELEKIIRNGIPGTPMPGSNMSEDQAERIVAYLRSNMSEDQAERIVAYLRSTAAVARATSVAGDPARGRALFEGKGGCLKCHRVDGVGSRLGPDLSDVGRFRRSTDLERSLTIPDDEILGQNRFYRVVDKEGRTITGRLLNLDTFTVQMLDSNEQLRSFIKSDVREHGFIDKSPMPSYKDTLTPVERADIVTFLSSLRVRNTQ
jgi:putative heme-binding domain-containing protein